MINAIIDGICVAINSEFGDAHEIYTETVEQGLKEPCFSILCLNPTIERFFGKKYFRTNKFCIHYFPSSDEPIAECNAVAERLFFTLENINVEGDPIFGKNMKYEVVDGVLSFFVNYDLFIYRLFDEETMMEVYSYKPEAKG